MPAQTLPQCKYEPKGCCSNYASLEHKKEHEENCPFDSSSKSKRQQLPSESLDTYREPESRASVQSGGSDIGAEEYTRIEDESSHPPSPKISPRISPEISPDPETGAGAGAGALEIDSLHDTYTLTSQVFGQAASEPETAPQPGRLERPAFLDLPPSNTGIPETDTEYTSIPSTPRRIHETLRPYRPGDLTGRAMTSVIDEHSVPVRSPLETPNLAWETEPAVSQSILSFTSQQSDGPPGRDLQQLPHDFVPLNITQQRSGGSEHKLLPIAQRFDPGGRNIPNEICIARRSLESKKEKEDGMQGLSQRVGGLSLGEEKIKWGEGITRLNKALSEVQERVERTRHDLEEQKRKGSTNAPNVPGIVVSRPQEFEENHGSSSNTPVSDRNETLNTTEKVQLIREMGEDLAKLGKKFAELNDQYAKIRGWNDEEESRAKGVMMSGIVMVEELEGKVTVSGSELRTR